MFSLYQFYRLFNHIALALAYSILSFYGDVEEVEASLFDGSFFIALTFITFLFYAEMDFYNEFIWTYLSWVLLLLD